MPFARFLVSSVFIAFFAPSMVIGQQRLAGTIFLESGERVPFYDVVEFNRGWSERTSLLRVVYQGAAREVPKEALRSICIVTFPTDWDFLHEGNGVRMILATSETIAEVAPVGLGSIAVKQRDPFSGGLTEQTYRFIANPTRAVNGYRLNIRRIDFAWVPLNTMEEELVRLLTEAGRRLLGMPNRPALCG